MDIYSDIAVKTVASAERRSGSLYFAEIDKMWALVSRENMTGHEEWEPVQLYDVLQSRAAAE